MKTTVFLSIILLLSATACNDNDDNYVITKEARIRWMGQCGFFFDIDSISYKADNEIFLDSSYRVSSTTNALLTYINLNNELVYYCGFTGEPNSRPGIHIIKIKKASGL